MKKLMTIMIILSLVFLTVPTQAWAVNTATHGKITGKTVCAGLLSLIVWPGIGQYLNDNETKKNVTHAVVGILAPFRFWSGWDALINRQGGRWDGKI